MAIKGFCCYCNKEVVLRKEGGHALVNPITRGMYYGYKGFCTDCDNNVDSGIITEINIKIISESIKNKFNHVERTSC